MKSGNGDGRSRSGVKSGKNAAACRHTLRFGEKCSKWKSLKIAFFIKTAQNAEKHPYPPFYPLLHTTVSNTRRKSRFGGVLQPVFRDFAKNFPQRRNNGKFSEKTDGNFFAPTITIRQKWRHMRAAIHLIRQKILRTRAKLLCPPEKRRIFCSPALSSTGQTFQVFGAPQYAGRPPANSP